MEPYPHIVGIKTGYDYRKCPLERQVRQSQKNGGDRRLWPEVSPMIFNNILSAIIGYTEMALDDIS